MAEAIEKKLKEKPAKSYAVKFKEGNARAKTQKFGNLADARIFASEKYREGSFQSLKNAKGIVLPLTRVIKHTESGGLLEY
jgi:hypothetical protein